MEDNLKKIVSETIRLNREAGFQVDENVIAFVACLQEVQNSWGELTQGASLASGPFDASLISSISKILSAFLNQTDSPFLAAAKMQVMMEVVSKKQQISIQADHSERLEQAAMLARTITSTPPTKTKTVQAYEKLHKLVVEYVCVQSGMERAVSDEAAREEVRAAVESVFPLSTLARFLTLGQDERLQQIEELSRIALGICLYNRHTGNGSLALPPATQTYLPQGQRLQRDLARHASELSAALTTLHALQAAAPAPGASEEQAAEAHERARAEGICVAQAFSTFQQLSSDLGAGLDTAQQLDSEIQKLLLEVTDSIGASVSVSKESVYPMFDRLGSLHKDLSEELRLLVVRQRLYDEAVGLLGGYASILPAPGKARARTPNAWLSSLTVPSAEEQAAQELSDASLQDQEIPELPEGCTYVEPAQCSSEEQRLQLLQGVSLGGFCGVALALQGALRLSKPSLGTVQVAESAAGPQRQLGFSSLQALRDFAADPAALLAKVDEAALKQPLLAKALGLSHVHPSLNIRAAIGTIMAAPLKVDFGCQTPTHFLESFIDHSYEWNEWALRRRALALANLRQKRTHSTQTALTHFKRDGDTQVWLPKQAQVQTRVNKGQAMPKKLQYVAGLRGPPSTKMNVIRLELDLGQPHQH